MRSSTAGEQAVLAAKFRKTYYRVKIADFSGVMQDYADYASYGWLLSVTIDENIDQPIATCTITLRREIDLVGGLGLTSLSPFRTDSPANPDGPSVTVFRSVEVSIAVVTGDRPVDGSTDWKVRFDGVTDDVQMPDDDTIVVTCRDRGAHLVDNWVTDPDTNLSGAPHIPQKVDALLPKLFRYVLDNDDLLRPSIQYKPHVPSYVVTSFPLKSEPIMTAISRMVQLFAGDFRWAWDDTNGAYRFTVHEPERDTPSVDWTFSSADIIKWRRLGINRLGIRNHIVVSYVDRATGKRVTRARSDAASIALYGRRILTIQEADDSSIDTQAEVDDLLQLILPDLKDPKAEAEIEMLPDWRVELNDYDTFSANKYFDIDQNLAVVGVKFELDPDDQRMTLTVRGNPSAGYQRWIERARFLDPTALTPTDNGLYSINYTDAADGSTRTWTWTRGDNVAFVGLYEAVVTTPVTADTWPAPASVPGTNGSVLPTTTNSWVATNPPKGSARIGLLVPYYKQGGHYVIGDAVKLVLYPSGDVPLLVRARITASTATTCTVRVAVADPYPQGAGSATITYTETGGTGTAASPASGGTVTPESTLTEAAGTYIDYTVTRPDFTSGSRRITFTATATDRVSATDAVDIPAVERDTVELLCRAKVQSTSATQVVVRVAVADYVSGGSGNVTLTYTATGCTVNTPSSPQTLLAAGITNDIDTTATVDVTMDRAAFLSGPGRVTFTATRSGRVPSTDSVDIPSQDQQDPSQGTVSVASNGTWEATVDGPANALSFRWSSSTSSYPADATVAASGTLVTGTGRLLAITGGAALTFGQTVYITIVPFDATGGGGNALPSIHIRGSYQSFTATKFDTIPGSAFVPRDSALTSVRTEPTTGAFVADPGSNPIKSQGTAALRLASGLTVTSVDMYCKMTYSVPGSPNNHRVTVAVGAINRSTQVVTTVGQPDTSSSSAAVQLVTVSGLSHTVDTSTYAYFATVFLADPNSSSTALEMYSITIGYTQNDPSQGL